jgi:hypothetical protein
MLVRTKIRHRKLRLLRIDPRKMLPEKTEKTGTVGEETDQGVEPRSDQ